MTSILLASASAAAAAAAPERTERAARPLPAASPAAGTAGAGAGDFASLVDAAAPTAPAEASDAPSASGFHQTSRSGVLDPVARFESFVLGTFVETMLPKDDNGLFGGGTAGNMWRSMLAERIGEELARSGGVGIADMIRERKTPSTGG